MCIKCYCSNFTFLTAKKEKIFILKLNMYFINIQRNPVLKRILLLFCYINISRPYLKTVHFRWKNVYFIFNIIYRVILKSWDRLLEEVGCIRRIQNCIATHVPKSHFNPLQIMCFLRVLTVSSAYYRCPWMLHCLTER